MTTALLRYGNNTSFLRTSTRKVDLLLTDPPWGADTQNKGTIYEYKDRPEDRSLIIDNLTGYAQRNAEQALIACDDRWQPYWSLSLREAGFNTALIICESELGNPGKSNFGKKHYYYVHAWREEKPSYFSYNDLPVQDRRDKIGEGRVKKACSVIKATISNTDPERVTGFVAQKPIWLMEAFIRTLCPPGGIVVDPYAGTGSVGIACKRTGRKFFGMEENPDTYMLASERINVG